MLLVLELVQFLLAFGFPVYLYLKNCNFLNISKVKKLKLLVNKFYLFYIEIGLHFLRLS